VLKVFALFYRGSAYNKTEAQRQLDESNKGHQMLRKMGWGGAGLGAKEQGIEQPISGGEVGILACQFKIRFYNNKP
jgi:calcium homeostasis ER protein